MERLSVIVFFLTNLFHYLFLQGFLFACLCLLFQTLAFTGSFMTHVASDNDACDVCAVLSRLFTSAAVRAV